MNLKKQRKGNIPISEILAYEGGMWSKGNVASELPRNIQKQNLSTPKIAVKLSRKGREIDLFSREYCEADLRFRVSSYQPRSSFVEGTLSFAL